MMLLAEGVTYVRHVLDQVWIEFRCAVVKGLTGTSTSHPGVSGIRRNKATLPPSGVDGLLLWLLEQRLVVPRRMPIAFRIIFIK